MGNNDLLLLLLYGVSGTGVFLGLIVLASALLNRRLDRREAEGMPLEKEEVSDPRQRHSPARAPLFAPDGQREQPIERTQETPPTQTKPPSIGDAAAFPIDGKTRKAEERAISVPGLVSEQPIYAEAGGYALRAFAGSHIGARKEQQDAVSLYSARGDKGFLAVVCDGMGGMRMGADAAQLAVTSFADAFFSSDKPIPDALRDAVIDANEKVWRLCETDDLSGAGTTIVAACVDEEGFYYISVGDSHVYLLRGGVLSQLNVDHNYLSELLHRVRKGELTREQALSDPERAHLTSYLGMRRLSLIDRSTGAIQLEEGDRILLASDGLFKVLTPADIAERMAETDEGTPARLIGEVLDFGYRNQDNISVAVIALDARPAD